MLQKLIPIANQANGELKSAQVGQGLEEPWRG